MSSPLISPSEIGVSPCLPDIVPVSLFPSAFKLKVCWRVWPSLPGRSAIHLPLIPPLEHDSAKTAINAHAKREPAERLVESRLNIRFLRRYLFFTTARRSRLPSRAASWVRG